MFKGLIAGFFLIGLALGQVTQQPPLPEPPHTYLDTAYHRPSGSTVRVRKGDNLQDALDAVHPGDTILIEAGATFIGNFLLRPKTGEGWIYIESSAIENKVHPGQRVSPDDAASMPKIETSNSDSAIDVLPSANNYRLVGLEITPAAGAPRPYSLVNIDYITSRIEAKIRTLAKSVAPALSPSDNFPHNIVIDRCYIHGSNIQDVREGVAVNGIAVAIIDSHISDIHDSTADSQAILSYRTPGPIKIVNNLLSATTEDVMFGGAGDYNNPYIPSDIEIRRNHFFKPLAWESCGTHGTVPPGAILRNGAKCPNGQANQWVEKNNLEFKSGRRAVVTGNVFENTWASGQLGGSVVFTTRTSQSGNSSVVNDILFQSNFLKNVDSGIGTLEQDDTCNAHFGYPNCTNAGESRRIWVDNNLLLLSPNPDVYQHVGLKLDGGNSTYRGETDFIFQHNTVLMSDLSTLWNSIYFELPQLSWGCKPPARFSATHNVWILDNVMMRQPNGDCGFVTTEGGVNGLGYYMGDPAPLAPRFAGNVMYVPSGDRMQSFPPKNSAQTKVTFTDTAAGNYQLATPKWTQTTDGTLAGVDMTALEAAIAGTTTPAAGDKRPESNPPPGTTDH
jgi:hypothetical protein